MGYKPMRESLEDGLYFKAKYFEIFYLQPWFVSHELFKNTLINISVRGTQTDA